MWIKESTQKGRARFSTIGACKSYITIQFYEIVSLFLFGKINDSISSALHLERQYYIGEELCSCGGENMVLDCMFDNFM